MCNTWSKVYLQSMKTYILSVNTLTRNLTLERHDNCVPCLGLILPIRWVTPPPKVLFEVFHSWRYICYVFTFGLASISTCLHDYLHYVDDIYIYTLVFCPLQHSLIAMSSCWIFWTKSMWSDPNLLYAFYLKLYLPKSYAFYWNCRMSSLRPC